MVQILDTPESFSSQLAKGLGRNLGNFAGGTFEGAINKRREKEENEALPFLKGVTNPELRKELVKAHVTGKEQKKLEKENALQIGMGTIDKMRSLISSAGPSNFVQGLFGGETTKNRAELEALGRSLIPLVAAGVPIRNQKEFEEYRKVIANPNSRQAEFEGALNGLQDLFERSLSQAGAEEAPVKEPAKVEESKKVRFNPKHPEHIAKFKQLNEKFKGDRIKVNEALAREFTQ